MDLLSRSVKPVYSASDRVISRQPSVTLSVAAADGVDGGGQEGAGAVGAGEQVVTGEEWVQLIDVGGEWCVVNML